VQLPVLPDARMDTRNEIASLRQVLQQLDARKNREDDGKLRSLRQPAEFSGEYDMKIHSEV